MLRLWNYEFSLGICTTLHLSSTYICWPENSNQSTSQSPALLVPEKLLSSSLQVSIIPLFGKTGIVPVKSLLSKSRSVRAWRFEIDAGIVPVSPLSFRRRLFNDVNPLTASGYGAASRSLPPRIGHGAQWWEKVGSSAKHWKIRKLQLTNVEQS